MKYTLADRSSTARFITNAPSLTLGGFFDFRHSGAKDNDNVSISLERDPKGIVPSLKQVTDFSEATGLSLAPSANKSTNKIEVARIALSDSKGVLLVEANESGRWTWHGLAPPYQTILGVRLINFLPDLVPLQSTEKTEKTAKRKRAYSGEEMFNAFLSAELQNRLWLRTFEEIEHIAPLRAHMPWYASSAGQASSLFGAGGENLIQSLASTVPVRGKKTLLDLVNEWLSTKMKLISNIRIKNVDRDKLVWSLLGDDPEGHTGINIAAMGEGISQSLPIIAAAISLSKGGCLAIEQPELHLHPAAQADLGDLFVDTAKDGTRQVLVETHSEHVLLRIRRRIAEGVIDPQRISILFVSKIGGESCVKRLELNARGHFDTEWPDGFFDEVYKEALALALAQTKK